MHITECCPDVAKRKSDHVVSYLAATKRGGLKILSLTKNSMYEVLGRKLGDKLEQKTRQMRKSYDNDFLKSNEV